MPVPGLNNGQRSDKAIASAVGAQFHPGEGPTVPPGGEGGEGEGEGSSRAQGEGEAAAHLETLLMRNVLSPIANFIAAPDLSRAQGITGTKLQYLGTLRLQFLKSQ